jgi:signal peptidase I
LAVDQEKEQQYTHMKNETIEWIKAIMIAAGLVFLIRWFIFAPFIVEGPSMQPNLYTGERLIVNKILYTMRPPKRGEVIVFHAPEQKDYIKRVIALPGETIKVEGDDVYINDRLLQEPYIQEQINEAIENGTLYNTTKDFNVTDDGVIAMKVPERSLFVMGDNRPNSKDSRWDDVGFIPYGKVVGRADLIFWPIDKFQLIKHYNEVTK